MSTEASRRVDVGALRLGLWVYLGVLLFLSLGLGREMFGAQPASDARRTLAAGVSPDPGLAAILVHVARAR
jgi:hypothetical protein